MVIPDLTIESLRTLLTRQSVETIEKEGFRRAAVLVPFYHEFGEWHLLFTKRTEDLEHHKGQVSFPGGALEDGESPEQAALREAFEEVGLQTSSVEIIARLDDIWTPSYYIITPVVGVISSVEGLSPSPDEVAKIIRVPLQFFADDSHVRLQRVHVNGFTRTVYFYDYLDEKIWGATAFIVRDCLRRLALIASS